MTEIKPFNPNDAIKLCGDEKQRPNANLNQAAGPAYSLYLNKKPIACGGVRCYGVGELWMLTTDENREKYTKEILRASKEQIDLMIRENHLWRLMAETDKSESFLKHLGFVESEKRFFTTR